MFMKEKELYETPRATVLDVAVEGIICISDPDGMGTGNLPGFTF